MDINITNLPSKGIFYDKDFTITIKSDINTKELFALHDALFNSPDLMYMHKLEAEIVERFYLFDNQHSADDVKLCDIFSLCLKTIEDREFYIYYPTFDDVSNNINISNRYLKSHMLAYANINSLAEKTEYIEERKSYKYKNLLLSEPSIGNMLKIFEYSQSPRNFYTDGPMNSTNIVHDYIDLTLVGYITGNQIVDLDTIELIIDMLKETLSREERLEMHKFINETFISLKGFYDQQGRLRSMKEVYVSKNSWPTLAIL